MILLMVIIMVAKFINRVIISGATSYNQSSLIITDNSALLSDLSNIGIIIGNLV